MAEQNTSRSAGTKKSEKHYYGKTVNETLEEFRSSRSGLIGEQAVQENREEF